MDQEGRVAFRLLVAVRHPAVAVLLLIGWQVVKNNVIEQTGGRIGAV